MNSKMFTSLFQWTLVIACPLIFVYSSWAAEQCKEPIARIASIQGNAQVQQDGKSDWQVTELDYQFCPGDILRVAVNSRVAVVLVNETILRIDQKSTVTFPKSTEDKYSILELFQGVLHIFSHRPRSLKVVTPYVNGVVEGTEFLVRSDQDQSVITVFEGMVTAINQHGQINLSSNQSALTTKGTAPQYMTVVRPRDAVEWTLYYPAIVEQPEEASANDIRELIRQTENYLSVGRIKEAGELLANILQNDPQNSDAYALSSIIETVRNNKKQALDFAHKALS